MEMWCSSKNEHLHTLQRLSRNGLVKTWNSGQKRCGLHTPQMLTHLTSVFGVHVESKACSTLHPNIKAVKAFINEHWENM